VAGVKPPRSAVSSRAYPLWGRGV